MTAFCAAIEQMYPAFVYSRRSSIKEERRSGRHVSPVIPLASKNSLRRPRLKSRRNDSSSSITGTESDPVSPGYSSSTSSSSTSFARHAFDSFTLSSVPLNKLTGTAQAGTVDSPSVGIVPLGTPPLSASIPVGILAPGPPLMGAAQPQPIGPPAAGTFFESARLPLSTDAFSEPRSSLDFQVALQHVPQGGDVYDPNVVSNSNDANGVVSHSQGVVEANSWSAPWQSDANLPFHVPSAFDASFMPLNVDTMVESNWTLPAPVQLNDSVYQDAPLALDGEQSAIFVPYEQHYDPVTMSRGDTDHQSVLWNTLPYDPSTPFPGGHQRPSMDMGNNIAYPLDEIILNNKTPPERESL